MTTTLNHHSVIADLDDPAAGWVAISRHRDCTKFRLLDISDEIVIFVYDLAAIVQRDGEHVGTFYYHENTVDTFWAAVADSI